MSAVRLSGIDTYYTVEGDGPPLILLHGGMADGTTWGPHAALLADRYRVYVPDRRGHGRTPDSDAPFSYDSMAAETIEFCGSVVGAPAHLVGWSDGGNTALVMSLARPDLVNRQVLIGANFHHSGVRVEELGIGDGPDDPEVAFLREIFIQHAPDGADRWPTYWAKIGELWRTQPTLTTADLGGVSVPTLVVVGDDEPIPLSHTVELYESIPDAQLGIVPGTSHVMPLEQPDALHTMIDRFLTMDLPPETMAPIRRR